MWYRNLKPFAARLPCVKFWGEAVEFRFSFAGKKNASRSFWQKKTTLQGINISHLGKRKIIFNMPFLGDMLVPWRVLPWQSIICQHFPKNVNALLFQQRRGIMISSSSCAREPSWENDVCHDVSCYISLWLAGENRKICATNHQMSPTCHYCSQLNIMPPVPLQFSARLTRVKRIKKNWSQSL